MLVKFFKEHNLMAIRQKLITVYLLNVTDIIFTELLITTGYFIESNLLMKNIVENIYISIVIKVLLPFALILILYMRIEKATDRQLHISNVIINSGILFYGLINVSHIIWSMMYFKIT